METIGPCVKTKCVEDSIDRLPDELLLSIVSRLPVMDAGRTTVLARRWRYFWMFSSVLNFNGSQVLRALEESGRPLIKERVTFMKGVNKVLKLHTGTTIEEFRVVFDLDEPYARVINQWIKFAFAKSVRNLELNLAVSCTGVLHKQPYIFPNVCNPAERLTILPFGLSSCQSLVTLSLTKVNVTGEVLEFFISNCPFLEELCVRESSHLKSLRISSPSVRLRRLEIVNCQGLISLQICSPNMRSFTFYHLYGPKIIMDLKNVSSLTCLSTGADQSPILGLNLVQFSRCFSHLETLMLHTPAALTFIKLPESLYFPRLRKLIFDVCVWGHGSLLNYAPLINGAPLLREIVLKLVLYEPWNQKIIEHQPVKGHRHHHLEVLRIEGFAGTTPDVGLAQYVLDNAVSLKKLVIDSRPPFVFASPHTAGTVRAMTQRAMIDVRMATARDAICLLKAKLPAGVELIMP